MTECKIPVRTRFSLYSDYNWNISLKYINWRCIVTSSCLLYRKLTAFKTSKSVVPPSKQNTSGHILKQFSSIAVVHNILYHWFRHPHFLRGYHASFYTNMPLVNFHVYLLQMLVRIIHSPVKLPNTRCVIIKSKRFYRQSYFCPCVYVSELHCTESFFRINN